MKAHAEIERKFLISMPSRSFLTQMGGERWEIVQTYLDCPQNVGSRRVRKIHCAGKDIYLYTEKVRISTLTCEEKEREIGLQEYERLLAEARTDSAPVEKVRYRIPYEGHRLEIDVYPSRLDVAVLEIELESEKERYTLPAEIHVLREVSGEAAYKNTEIAHFLKEHPGQQLPF